MYYNTPRAQNNALFNVRPMVSEIWNDLSKLGQRSLSATRIKSDQGPHTYTTVPLEDQIYAIFALQSTVSELWTILSKVPQRSLSAPRIKSDQTPYTSITVPWWLK